MNRAENSLTEIRLELEHINPYVPYSLEFKINNKICKLDHVIVGMNSVADWNSNYYFIDKVKPILRSIKSMTKEEAYELGLLIMGEADMEDKKVGIGDITLNGNTYPVIMYQDQKDDEYSIMIQFSTMGISGIDLIPYEAYKWLLKNHFDIFGLIRLGLAVERRI